MPTFEIPDGPTTVELKRSGDAASPGPATGSIVFNVTNKSADACDGRLGIVVSGASKEAWFTIEGERERTFAAGETQTATIRISAPPDVSAGSYPFRLRAVTVNDPDNDHAEGPVATATVPAPAAAAPKGSKWWLWLLIALLVLAAIGAALWFAFGRGGGDDETVAVENKPLPTPQPPPTAQPTTPSVAQPVIPRPTTPTTCNLSGLWRGNDGGTYRITQSGNRISWRGQSADGGRSWAHNFRGVRDGSVIKGSWADTAGPMGRGTLTLRVASQTRLTRTANTGSGFGGTMWTRPRPCG